MLKSTLIYMVRHRSIGDARGPAETRIRTRDEKSADPNELSTPRAPQPLSHTLLRLLRLLRLLSGRRRVHRLGFRPVVLPCSRLGGRGLAFAGTQWTRRIGSS